MIQINDALAIARADVANIARFIERRERFLDALDWSMMTDAQVRQSSMLDELLDEDLAIGLHYIDWLIDRVDSQVPTPGALRFAPHPRPWHAEWNTLAA
ncbi:MULTISPECIES: hypothetical protein [unclassified Sphingomonas]|jgi:hypothetical protein|uniref:hypothetical protein n=1 Tax=unclassified Sphingomonas TaxID=196159 RepID=UPI000A55813F|nr:MULTISPECIES: hypothetical protein [unclassified Sphingomonas]MBB3588708.1 hypothetical protein [Sphingomonas sp. BK481]